MKRLDCEQGSADWFEARRGIPTASEFGKIITPKRGELSTQSVGYIAELIEQSAPDYDPEELCRSYWMERGREMEPDGADWYEFRYAVELQKVGIILNHDAGYSPDRLVVGQNGAIEIKCPKPSTHIKWLLKGGLPDEHKPQVHGGLHIGELDWIDFVSYCPGYRKLVVRVTPDTYTQNVAAALRAFNDAYEQAKNFIQEAA